MKWIGGLLHSFSSDKQASKPQNYMHAGYMRPFWYSNRRLISYEGLVRSSNSWLAGLISAALHFTARLYFVFVFFLLGAFTYGLRIQRCRVEQISRAVEFRKNCYHFII